MRFPAWRFGLLLGVFLAGAGCSSKSSTDEQKKVDELQAQLDDVKKQLAAKDEQAATPQPASAAKPAERPATNQEQ
jgi:outer membrane murein-binding lipoprotein Lpp